MTTNTGRKRTRADIAAQTREAILNAACEVIAEIGFEKIRMRMVAERAGVSTAALHYHFDTRENLFAEALRYSFDHTGADVYEAQGNGDTATARLARIISASLPLTPSLRREWAMWQELWCRAGRDPESRTLAIELYRAPPGLDRGDPRRRDRVGRVQPCDTTTHAQLISSLCDGFGVQLMIPEPHPDPRRRPRGDLVASRRARSAIDVPFPEDAALMTTRAPQPLPARLPVGGATARPARDDAGLRLHRAPPGPKALPTKPIVPKIDGDLVYFNWAEYVDPKVFKGFEKEYGVKVIESNFDSMESMQAKLAAGNRYDIIFPSAQWVQKLTAANQLRRDRPRRRWTNAARDLRPLRLLRRPLVRPELGALGPVHDVQDRDRLAQGQARRRADRQLGRPLERDAEAAGRSCSTTATRCWAWPRCCSGCRSTPPTTDDLDEIVDKFDSAAALPARLQQRRLQQPARRRRLDAPDLERRHGRPALAGRRPVHLRLRVAERGRRRSTPTPTPSRRNAEHPGTALLFIDYMLRPENVEKNINYIGYPMPVHGTEDVYEELVADYPECQVTLEDLEHGPLLRQRQRRRRPGPRRGVHRDQGRLMTRRPPDRRETGVATPGRAAVDLAAGARHALDVAVLRLRPAADGRAELRHHRRARQPAVRHHARQHPRRLRRRPTCA